MMSNKMMKAVGVIPAKKEVAMLDHRHPVLEADSQVKVRTLDVGICGTDREICTFVYGGSTPEGFEHLVLGHESLGEVVEVGSGVGRVKVGDLVVPSVRRPCPDTSCRPCLAGRQDFCQTMNFSERGIKDQHGYMTEFWVEEEQYLTVVPLSLRDFAVLAEPLTIAEKGLEQLWGLQQRLPWANTEPGELPGAGLNAVVLGAGPIGILGAMKCVLEGFDTYVYSRSKKPNDKAAIVEAIGAKYISNLEVSPPQLAEEVGSIDFVYEALGVAQVSFDVMMEMGLNAAFCFTGIPEPEGEVTIPGNQLMRNLVLKNQLVYGTVNADRAAFENAIADLAEVQKRWPEALAQVITGRFAPEDYEELLVGKAKGIKNVISFEGGE